VDLRAYRWTQPFDIYAPIKIANFAVTCQRRREVDNVVALTATKKKTLQLEGKI
jgi:hypothetical protein